MSTTTFTKRPGPSPNPRRNGGAELSADDDGVAERHSCALAMSGPRVLVETAARRGNRLAGNQEDGLVDTDGLEGDTSVKHVARAAAGSGARAGHDDASVVPVEPKLGMRSTADARVKHEHLPRPGIVEATKVARAGLDPSGEDHVVSGHPESRQPDQAQDEPRRRG